MWCGRIYESYVMFVVHSLLQRVSCTVVPDSTLLFKLLFSRMVLLNVLIHRYRCLG